MSKKRKVISPKEKDLFITILKESEGGRFWEVIVKGGGSVTNQSRHDTWVKVSKHFSEAMEAEFTPKQCKDLWGRIKEGLKKNHDSGLSKFKKDCSMTGGGPSPTPPPSMDGDDYCDEMDFLDPSSTPFNGPTTPLSSHGKVASFVPNRSDTLKSLKMNSIDKLSSGKRSPLVEVNQLPTFEFSKFVKPSCSYERNELDVLLPRKKCVSIEKKQDATKKSASKVLGSSVFAEVNNRELFGDFDEENSDTRVMFIFLNNSSSDISHPEWP